MSPSLPLKAPLEVLRLYRPHDYTLASALRSRADVDAERVFLTYEGSSLSWRDFIVLADATAAMLAGRGIIAGDRVAIVARNCDAHVLLLFGLARLGAILVPVNPDFGVAEMRYVLGHAGVAGIVASPETLATVDAAAASLGYRPWFLTTGEGGEHPAFRDAIASAGNRDLPEPGAADDTCLIIYTSGTTGFPKGAMHSQRSFLLGGEAFIQRVRLQPDDRVMIVLPLYHMNALFYSVAGTVNAGASMLIAPRFSASTFWATAAGEGVTQVNIIEAIGTILQARPRTEYRADHRIRAVYGVRDAVAATFRNEFGIHHLIGGYGMTEIPGVTCTPYEGHDRGNTMGVLGQHPNPDQPWAECRVVSEGGDEVPAGEVGELWVRTPIVTQGYFGDPEQTAAAFKDGWFMTGDLVRREADGYFFFVSRKKDIIRRRGENIAGAELDRVIGAHPAVFQVAAIAVPSELGEDEILAAVVLREGHELEAEALAAWCGERLAPMKVPRFVAFLDALPHTPTHKIAKAVLRGDPTVRERAVDLAAPRHTAGR